MSTRSTGAAATSASSSGRTPSWSSTRSSRTRARDRRADPEGLRQADQVPAQHAPPRRPRRRQRGLQAVRHDRRARQRRERGCWRRPPTILRDYPALLEDGEEVGQRDRGQVLRGADRVGEEGQGRGDRRPPMHDVRFGAPHLSRQDETIQVWHLPPAHTDGDSVVYFEKAKVLHMGDDFFNGVDPVHRRAGRRLGARLPGGPRQGHRRGCRRTSSIIPGHGEVTDLAGLKAFRQYIADLLDAAGKAKIGREVAVRTSSRKWTCRPTRRFGVTRIA